MLDRPFRNRAQADDDIAERQDEELSSGERNETDLGQEAATPELKIGEEDKPNAEEQPTLKEDPLVASAIRELKRVENDLSLAEEERRARLSVFVAHVYKASMAGRGDHERHEALLLKSGITVQTNTPHHKQTLRAILTLAGAKLVKQTEHECCLVLDGLEVSGVAEDEVAVLKFLSEPAEIEGRRVVGFARAKAARAASKQLQAECVERRTREDAEKDETLHAIVARSGQNRIGAIEVADEDADLAADLWLSVNRGHDVLMALKVKPEQLRSIVLKYTAMK